MYWLVLGLFKPPASPCSHAWLAAGIISIGGLVSFWYAARHGGRGYKQRWTGETPALPPEGAQPARASCLQGDFVSHLKEQMFV